ncbi:hypothetical protein GWO43_01420 [candidate division KSB1 bacterium]|nr:hypothetical protein [candidate division KSB1 bacterium]NIR69331.1 hypothetical protein [candidate division KSB1 bacterium]NIS22732.1 hypothetical protein [candidate division KSB1 bacterium]NIT69579.1 hypothetical protein [candidate division KSB1 bacterium]NIU23234.1 hypothetical protein [candidate division KSB1 bacterium]
MLRVYRNVALQFTGSVNILLGAKKDTLPYESGLLLRAGLYIGIDKPN